MTRRGPPESLKCQRDIGIKSVITRGEIALRMILRPGLNQSLEMCKKLPPRLVAPLAERILEHFQVILLHEAFAWTVLFDQVFTPVGAFHTMQLR
jgi:hypothetical protein